MRTEHLLDGVWLTLFLPLLAGVSVMILPQTPAIQLSVVPLWAAYWMLTRAARMGLWVSVWGGVLLESLWGVPPGGMVIALLILWYCARLIHWRLADSPDVRPIHGLLVGAPAVPLIHLWLWLYAMIWWGPTAAEPMAPRLGALVAAPAMGALGGGLLFALAQTFDFRVLRPKKEEAAGDEG